MDPHHNDADPDPSFHFDADPDLGFHFHADPGVEEGGVFSRKLETLYKNAIDLDRELHNVCICTGGHVKVGRNQIRFKTLIVLDCFLLVKFS